MDKSENHYLFFTTDLSGASCLIDESQCHHAVNVLRLKTGDDIRVSDGVGTVALCTLGIEFFKKRICTITGRQVETAITPAITCFIGLPEHDAFDEAVQNLAAMGVARVVPIECRFSQNKWWKKDWKKCRDRLQKKIVAGARQALYPFLLTVDEVVAFESVVQQLPATNTLVADQNGMPLRQTSALDPKPGITMVIGPPGGFAPDELDRFERLGCTKVTMGPTRLRTELAAVAACAALRTMYSCPE